MVDEGCGVGKVIANGGWVLVATVRYVAFGVLAIAMARKAPDGGSSFRDAAGRVRVGVLVCVAVFYRASPVRQVERGSRQG